MNETVNGTGEEVVSNGERRICTVLQESSDCSVIIGRDLLGRKHHITVEVGLNQFISLKSSRASGYKYACMRHIL